MASNGQPPHDPLSTNGVTTASLSSQTSFSHVCWELKRRVDVFLREEGQTELLKATQHQLKVAMGVVREALQRYRAEQIALSYNGGKDCLVLLVILLACLAEHLPNPSPDQPSTVPSSSHSDTTAIQSIYIVSPHPFPEIDDFVSSSSETYHLEVLRYQMGMKKALGAYLEDRPGVEAVFVGTRRTDPHGRELTHFDMTDEGWPRFMRVHPVIDWKYGIWIFLQSLNIPYLSLYDQGYTSLGGTKDTLPNPMLKIEGEDGHRPAYELVADEDERLGRTSKC